ncbi:MAG TPA: hypothetical protein VF219_21680 [Vicinamibacterales bacterium]
MHQPRSRVPAFGLLSVLTLALACSGSEQSIVGQFFSASRLRDNTSLDNVATVIFDPRTQGTVTTFTIQSVAPEQRKPLPLKALARAQDDAKAEDVEFTRRKEAYQDTNLEAIQRVLKAERENTKVAPKDEEVQAAWTKYREETAAMSKRMADARRSLKSETQFVDQSVNAGRTAIDVSKYDGEVVWKDVTVSAPVRLPSGETVDKTLVLTLQRAVLKGDKEISGRWIVTEFRDHAPARANK